MAIAPFKRDFGSLGYNAENKAAFLKAGKSYLRKILKTLKQELPDIEFKVSINEGGIAVSGEVYADIRLDTQRGIHLCLTELTFGRFGGDSPYSLFAQTRRAYPNDLNPKHLGQIVSGNHFMDVHDPEKILIELRKLVTAARSMEVNNEVA